MRHLPLAAAALALAALVAELIVGTSAVTTVGCILDSVSITTNSAVSTSCRKVIYFNVTIGPNAELTVPLLSMMKNRSWAFDLVSILFTSCTLASGGVLHFDNTAVMDATVSYAPSNVLVAYLKSVDGALLLRGKFPNTTFIVSICSFKLTAALVPKLGAYITTYTSFSKAIALVSVDFSPMTSFYLSDVTVTNFPTSAQNILVYMAGATVVQDSSTMNFIRLKTTTGTGSSRSVIIDNITVGSKSLWLITGCKFVTSGYHATLELYLIAVADQSAWRIESCSFVATGVNAVSVNDVATLSNISWLAITDCGMSVTSQPNPCISFVKNLNVITGSYVTVNGNSCSSMSGSGTKMWAGSIVPGSAPFYSRCNALNGANSTSGLPAAAVSQPCGTCNLTTDCFQPMTNASLVGTSTACGQPCPCINGITTTSCYPNPITLHVAYVTPSKSHLISAELTQSPSDFATSSPVPTLSRSSFTNISLSLVASPSTSLSSTEPESLSNQDPSASASVFLSTSNSFSRVTRTLSQSKSPHTFFLTAERTGTSTPSAPSVTRSMSVMTLSQNRSLTWSWSIRGLTPSATQISSPSQATLPRSATSSYSRRRATSSPTPSASTSLAIVAQEDQPPTSKIPPALMVVVIASVVPTIPSVAMSAQRTLLMTAQSNCEDPSDTRVSLLSSPTQMSLHPKEYEYLRGSVVGNWLLFLGCGFIMCLIAWARLRDTFPSFRECARQHRLPGQLLIPGLFLLQPTTTASLGILVHGVDSFDQALGGVSLLMIASPVFLVAQYVLFGFRCVRIPVDPYPVPAKDAFRRVLRRVVGVLFHETTEWYDPATGQYMDATAELIEPFRQDRHWFILVELFMCLSFGIFGGIMPSDRGTCDALIWTCTSLAAVYLALLFLLRPYIVPFDAWTATIGGISTLLACAMSLVHNEEGSLVADNVAVWSALITFGVNIACAVAHPPVAARRYAKTAGLRRHLFRYKLKLGTRQGHGADIVVCSNGAVFHHNVLDDDVQRELEAICTPIGEHDAAALKGETQEGSPVSSMRDADDGRLALLVTSRQLRMLLTAAKSTIAQRIYSDAERHERLQLVVQCICLATRRKSTSILSGSVCGEKNDLRCVPTPVPS